MIETTDLLPLIVQAYPGAHDELVKTVDDWFAKDGTISPCMVLATIGSSVEARIEKGDFEGLGRLFELIERLLVEGCQDLRDAAATCFLEHLINRSDSLDPRLFVPLMGNESRRYCRAWDEFTGVKTPGLYEGGDEDS